jgi:YfiH family protein
MLQLRAENLSTLSGIAHGFFGRTGGISKGIFDSLNCGPGSADDRANVIENRRRVAAALGKDVRLVTAGQIHETHVITVTRPWSIGTTPEEDKTRIPLGDAMVTRESGIALGILTADCAPVLLADAEARVIGAAHAGWRGAISGVLEATLIAMETLGAARPRIAAAIGPCIGQPNYEVGPELFERFVAADAVNTRYFVPSNRAQHYRFDLESYVADRLVRAGVGDVARIAACTYARDADFFSFRRNTHCGEKEYGREISAILLCK